MQVRKMFGAQTVLDGVSFRVNAGEHLGIVGPNGAGKSTIFSLISGAMEPDRGEVVLPKKFRLGHLRQQLFAAGKDSSLLGYTLNAIPELDAMETEIQELESSLPSLTGEEQERALNRLGSLQHDFEHLGGYDLQSRAEAALSALGFKESEFSRPFKSFSGGWQMRAELARVLIAKPDLLLLDEPSNYLDLPAIEWLQRYLRSFEGTMLLISHDRYLLRSLTNRTLEVAGGQTTRYQGGFDYYLREREARYDQQMAEWQNYTRKVEQIESFIRRFRAKSTKAAQVQSRVKQLESMDVVAKPVSAPDHSHLRIADPPHCGAKVMELQGAGFTYDGGERWIFKDVDLQINKGDKIALVGFNGMGKTTLLRSLAGTYNLAEGERRLGHKVVIGYQSQEFAETMPPDQSVLHVLKSANAQCSEKDVRTLLGSFGFSAEAVEKPVKVLSGGEKIRLAFARIFINPPNFLLLDEPTTHLDIQGREALERAIREYKGTVCLVSHDVEFVQNTAEQIVAMTPPGIMRFSGNYDYYLEKTGVTTEELKSTPAATKIVEPVTVGKGKLGRKARAEQREAQKNLKKLERELEKLQERQAEIHELMASQADNVNYSELNKELAELTGKIGEAEELWLMEAAQFEEA
ncbi:ABC-F family ATP-binding cassette domain-containing protein [Verrucomicrobiota bacterium]